MKYVNANTVLPSALVEELQKYIQAEYLYVPAKNEQRRAWGELSGYRAEICKRNERIVEKQLHHLQNVIIFLYMLLEKSFIRSNCGELHFVALFSIIWVCNVWCIESVYR